MENTSSYPKLCSIQHHLIQEYILISPEAISRSSLVRRRCSNVACPFGAAGVEFSHAGLITILHCNSEACGSKWEKQTTRRTILLVQFIRKLK